VILKGDNCEGKSVPSHCGDRRESEIGKMERGKEGKVEVEEFL